MQDRFKLKFWDNTDKELGEVINIDFNTEFVDFKTKDGITSTPLKSGELIQCTGLKDKNGKLIYDGDIVKLYNQNYKIIYERRGAYFGLYISKNETYYLNDINTQTSNMEIIGNIYENPELLEGENAVRCSYSF